MEEYLKTFHDSDIVTILQAQSQSDFPFHALEVDLSLLKENDPNLFNKINFKGKIWSEREKWKVALNAAQKAKCEEKMNNSKRSSFNVKENFPICFVNIPDFKNEDFSFDKLWQLVQVKGKVLRTCDSDKKEVLRDLKCRTCKKTLTIKADRSRKFYFEEPNKCPTLGCKGNLFNVQSATEDENLDNYIDYNEVSIQPTGKQELLTVELEEELIETCFVGDQVTVCGTFEIRATPKLIDSNSLVLRANSVVVDGKQQKITKYMAELEVFVRDDWRMDLENYGCELHARDEMVKSLAPELDGLSLLKLSVLIVLCSGGPSTITTSRSHAGNELREISHMLMIGDAGLGKSQLLKAAALIAPISVRCVGYGTTLAGLTARCIRENDQIHIEAGALVKANGGVCCIDEINFMQKEHRSSIHQVMEHQNITIAKAGVMTNIPTKVSIFASMNKKNKNLPVEMGNITMEPSLLSRFDLVFEIEDLQNAARDDSIIRRILSNTNKFDVTWSTDRLQRHIVVAKEIQVTISHAALDVINQYYSFCTHQDIDVSRKSMRLLQSLHRLTKCHAKLMLRSTAEIIDAVTVVMIMESSWSMGMLMKVENVISSSYPLGPEKSFEDQLLRKLQLEHLVQPKIETFSPKVSQNPSHRLTVAVDEIDDIFKEEDDDFEFSQAQPTSDTQQSLNTQALFEHEEKDFEMQIADENLDAVVISQMIEDYDAYGKELPQPPSAARTQFTQKSLIPKRMDVHNSMAPPQKKPKVVSQNTGDDNNIYKNLNFMAAKFAGGISGSLTSSATTSRNFGSQQGRANQPKPPSDYRSKLDQFRFSGSTLQSQSEVNENERNNNQSKSVHENISNVECDEIEDFDPFQ